MKKLLSTLLIVLMLFSLGACATKPESGSESKVESGSIFTAGKYTGTGKGHNGDISLDIEFDSEKIVDISVKEHQETSGVSDPAFENVIADILSQQSTQVDTVASATVTSEGIIEAVNDAIVQAGADPTALTPAASESKDSVESIEKTADVIVVGGGLAGLSAAVTAKQSGAEVILIEKLPAVGGSSAMSGGGVGATQTSEQEKNGIEDTNEEWKKLWEERQATSPAGEGKYPDWAAVDKIIEESGTTIDWLLDLGYEFRAPEGFGVDPVERLHFPTEGNGSVLTGFLESSAKELGVEIMLQTEATELITDDSGAVVGVKAKQGKADVTLTGNVILATGGFSRNKELLERFTPEVAQYVDYSVASVGNTGDGYIMAESVGAQFYENPWLIGLGVKSGVSEASSLYWLGKHIFVNEEGKRFTNEGAHYAIVYNDAVYNSKDGVYMVFDSSEAFDSYTKAVADVSDTDGFYKAETLEELAAMVGVDSAALSATIESYNNNIGNDEFGKSDKIFAPISQGPFYAVKHYPSHMGTIGGVVVDENGAVLDADGNQIKGLYAAGEMANRPYYNQVYMSGSALQVASATGRKAGTAAAADSSLQK